MTHPLCRRLDRVAAQLGGAGRVITLRIEAERAAEPALVEATLAASGIERSDADLVVLVRHFGTPGLAPPYSLLAVQPPPAAGRRAL